MRRLDLTPFSTIAEARGVLFVNVKLFGIEILLVDVQEELENIARFNWPWPS